MSFAEPIEFGIYQPMTSSSGEAAKYKYHLVVGKTGEKWVYADIPAAADQIFVDGGKGSEGMGGRTLTFELVDGGSVALTGPWKTSADGLFKDTGIDIRNRYTTCGIVAFGRTHGKYPGPDSFTEVVHFDKEPVVGEFDRIDRIAQEAANKAVKKVWFSVVTQGGGRASWRVPA